MFSFKAANNCVSDITELTQQQQQQQQQQLTSTST